MPKWDSNPRTVRALDRAATAIGWSSKCTFSGNSLRGKNVSSSYPVLPKGFHPRRHSNVGSTLRGLAVTEPPSSPRSILAALGDAAALYCVGGRRRVLKAARLQNVLALALTGSCVMSVRNSQ
jgi:hypothetical protein